MVIIGSGERHLYPMDAPIAEEQSAMETGGAVDSSATVAGGDVFLGSSHGAVYCLGPADEAASTVSTTTTGEPVLTLARPL
ncbi:MAG: PQQ-binding-like beta-propeller repeat protein [Armatimonadota bacterium]|nr:PQQ-binding-like beta-propeller repeat protein [Armatimonadota bacterium]